MGSFGIVWERLGPAASRTAHRTVALFPLQNKSFQYNPEVDITENIKQSKALVKKLEETHYEDKLEELYENSGTIDEKSDKLCSWVQIITACFSSFAHGSNLSVKEGGSSFLQ